MPLRGRVEARSRVLIFVDLWRHNEMKEGGKDYRTGTFTQESSFLYQTRYVFLTELEISLFLHSVDRLQDFYRLSE
jgi:hypothetical protein